jgi:uncharacterized membrane protein YheB (UPF0754 family)
MDLSTIEGLSLTEEQQAAISALHTAEIEKETSGLKAKNDELLNEKKTAAQQAKEAEDKAEEARLAAVEAEKQRLANEGKFDEYKKLHEKELAEATAKSDKLAETAQANLDKYHHSNALNGALSLIHDNFKTVSEAMLSNMIDVSYNEQSEPVIAFKHNGEVVANNVDEFKGWALTQDTFKNIMNGVDSGGAGSSNTGGAGVSNKSSDQQIADRINKRFQKLG